MRLAMVFTLTLSLWACSDLAPVDDDDPGGGDDPGDGGDDPGGGGDDDLDQPAVGFQIETPDITIEGGQEVTYCYYTTLPNQAQVGVKKWESMMTPGSHHMILYFLDELPVPSGTLDTNGCGLTAGDFSSVWTYAAGEPRASSSLPDGVGMAAEPGQPVVIQMHYLNVTEAPLTARVTINAHTWEDGVEYQQAYAYITYNDQIEVLPHQAGSAGGSCAVPAGLEFFAMSTHSHRFSTRVEVRDSGSMLVESTDWQHPEVASWVEAPYHQFAGNLDYHCEYFNDSDETVRTGDSADTDEMCMAIGYFFGGDGPIGCINSFAVPL